MLIPPWFLEDDQHWSLDPGPSFLIYLDKFKFILEKRLRELNAVPRRDTGKIITTGQHHMA